MPQSLALTLKTILLRLLLWLDLPREFLDFESTSLSDAPLFHSSFLFQAIDAISPSLRFDFLS